MTSLTLLGSVWLTAFIMAFAAPIWHALHPLCEIIALLPSVVLITVVLPKSMRIVTVILNVGYMKNLNAVKGTLMKQRKAKLCGAVVLFRKMNELAAVNSTAQHATVTAELKHAQRLVRAFESPVHQKIILNTDAQKITQVHGLEIHEIDGLQELLGLEEIPSMKLAGVLAGHLPTDALMPFGHPADAMSETPEQQEVHSHAYRLVCMHA